MTIGMALDCVKLLIINYFMLF